MRWTEQLPECCPDGCKLDDTRSPEQIRALGRVSMLECVSTVLGETGKGAILGFACVKPYDKESVLFAIDLPRIDRLIGMLERMRERLRKTS